MAGDKLDDKLQTLVDRRSERIEVEYKTWMPLELPETKAKIAKHLCALANIGGGYLIFGIDDTGGYSEPHPPDLSAYNHDVINNIVSAYLVPAFECEVRFVQSGVNRRSYPIVHVPTHGSAPICARKNGPQNQGKIVGVKKGTHYTRVPGPKSVPVEEPELWRSIIHRCVVNERDSLLSSISRLFDRPVEVPIAQEVDQLLDSGIALWEASQLKNGWIVNPIQNRCAFSFRFLGGSSGSVPRIPLDSLKKAIDEASRAAENESGFGWSLFEMLQGSERPSVDVFENGAEGYRAVSIHRDGTYLDAPAVWRIASDGRGVEVRGYHEDSAWVVKAANDRQNPGSWLPGAHFSPRLQERRVYQFVAFVRLLSKHFENVKKVEMAVDFQGLSGREIRDVRPYGFYRLSQKASVNERRVHIETSPEALIGNGSMEAAARLLAPVGRLFDGWEITSDSIQKTLNERR